MAWYDLVLFVHVLTVAVAFSAIGVIVSCTLRLTSTDRAPVARAAAATAARVGVAMPVTTLLLLVTGGAMTQSKWSWSTPWIDVSIVGLIAVTALGAGFIGTRERALRAMLNDSAADDLSPAHVARLRDPALLAAHGLNIGLVTGVIFVMVVKPPLAGSLAAMAVFAACGGGSFASLGRRGGLGRVVRRGATS